MSTLKMMYLNQLLTEGFDANLQYSPRYMLMVLAQRANGAKVIDVTLEQLMDHSRFDRRVITRVLNLLDAGGYIHIESNGNRKEGMTITIQYHKVLKKDKN